MGLTSQMLSKYQPALGHLHPQLAYPVCILSLTISVPPSKNLDITLPNSQALQIYSPPLCSATGSINMFVVFNQTLCYHSHSFVDVMDHFRDWLRNIARQHRLEGKVWLCGHKVFSSDALNLFSQFRRHQFDFPAWLSDVGVEAWIDTHHLATHLIPSLKGVALGLQSLHERYMGSKIGEGWCHFAVCDTIFLSNYTTRSSLET